MKRLCSLCLTLGMLCGAAATAGAVEIKAKGTWEILSEWSNVAPLNGPNDRFATLQRLRTQVEIISSNALKGVVFFEIGDTNWGKASEGGALGTDAKNIEVRYSYVDWQVPNTDLRVRMGLQPIILPGFVASGFSPVFGHDVAGIMLSQKWSDEVGTTFFWARPFNGNFGGWNGNGSQANGTPRDTPGDAMDLLSLIVPIKTDVMKVSPWGMFGFMGTKSLMGTSRAAIRRHGLPGPVCIPFSAAATRLRRSPSAGIRKPTKTRGGSASPPKRILFRRSPSPGISPMAV